MRKTFIITLFLLLGAHQGYAATVTARVTAHVLEPVNISFQEQGRDFAKLELADKVIINSAHDIHYELSHSPSDVCLLDKAPNAQAESKLALAGCETFTVNFN